MVAWPSCTATERETIRALQVGIERTFDQDPGLALRVLADIALRSLSPAIDDPTTAVQGSTTSTVSCA